MPHLRAHNIVVSLDGYATGEGQSLDAAFGHAQQEFMEWFGKLRIWRGLLPDGKLGADEAIASAWGTAIGAEIMGRNKFLTCTSCRCRSCSAAASGSGTAWTGCMSGTPSKRSPSPAAPPTCSSPVSLGLLIQDGCDRPRAAAARPSGYGWRNTAASPAGHLLDHFRSRRTSGSSFIKRMSKPTAGSISPSARRTCC